MKIKKSDERCLETILILSKKHGTVRSIDVANEINFIKVSIPLHTDEEYAKSIIFGQLIAPGVMSIISVWATYFENNLADDKLLTGKSTKTEWMKPVFAEDVLSSTCTVSNLVKRNEKNGLAELTFEVFNQHGELVLSDVTEMIVKCKPAKYN